MIKNWKSRPVLTFPLEIPTPYPVESHTLRQRLIPMLASLLPLRSWPVAGRARSTHEHLDPCLRPSTERCCAWQQHASSVVSHVKSQEPCCSGEIWQRRLCQEWSGMSWSLQPRLWRLCDCSRSAHQILLDALKPVISSSVRSECCATVMLCNIVYLAHFLKPFVRIYTVQ